MTLAHIFLDLDGVLVDFVSAALRLHDREDLLERWPPDCQDLSAALGLDRRAFWAPIQKQGEAFWRNLRAYPWAQDLLHALRSVAPVTIATSPSADPASAAGKMRWMDRNLGTGGAFRDFLIGPSKHLLARPDTALVDDTERKTRAFQRAGGVAVLFPQPWNSAGDGRLQATDPVAHVLSRL